MVPKILLEIGKEILKFTSNVMLIPELRIIIKCLRAITQKRSILSILYSRDIDMFNINLLLIQDKNTIFN